MCINVTLGESIGISSLGQNAPSIVGQEVGNAAGNAFIDYIANYTSTATRIRKKIM